jgi:peptide/nickel transport system permease protein
VRQVLRRVVYLAFILVIVTFLVSAMLELMPGDPAYVILGENADPEQIEALHERLRLDEPVYQRYLSWLGNAVTGDLGSSIASQQPMTEVIRDRLPVSIQLIIGSQIIALLFAVPTAIYGAYRPGRLVDNVSSVFSFGLLSVPSFVLATVLLLVFAVQLGWFPIAGYTSFTEDPVANMRSMLLPMLVVATTPAALYQRMLRNDMEATLREDYISLAEAKGLTTTRILLRHALRPSTFSLITLIGLTTAQVVGGSIIVETVFSLPGLGRQMILSIERHDVVAVQAIAAFIAVSYVVINAVVDISYGVLDPRVRRGRP